MLICYWDYINYLYIIVSSNSQPTENIYYTYEEIPNKLIFNTSTTYPRITHTRTIPTPKCHRTAKSSPGFKVTACQSRQSSHQSQSHQSQSLQSKVSTMYKKNFIGTKKKCFSYPNFLLQPPINSFYWQCKNQ